MEKRKACQKCIEQALTLATLCDMVLGEHAKDRTDEALIKGVRKLIRSAARIRP